MTSNIEREITALDFDGTKFRSGIDGSLKDLDRLKKGMNLDGAAKSFGEINEASKSLNFSPMANGIESVTTRLSAMSAVGFAVINRLTNSVIDATKKIFDTIITAPMKTGLEEYETQMNAIQTILANTKSKGTVLTDVQSALGELNEYADRTIYNFTNMTDSIGKFTAAGVDLDISVGAIKGIANLAAVSGSNSVQASTAMYQLSQAISTGSLKLQDWNSVVNAGLGGQIFQDELKETARVMGIAVDDIIADAGSFRDSLAEGWISDDVLLETLRKFTGDMSAAELEAAGYSQDQIARIQELGQLANDAATKIKTLSQLKDTIAEAMQSGWTETWQIIFGDFEEAKDMFGRIETILSGMVGASADARNDFFSEWKQEGGRDAAIQAVVDAFSILNNVMSAFKSGVSDIFEPLTGSDLASATKFIGGIVAGIRRLTEEGNVFRNVGRGIASIFDIIRMFVLALLSPFKLLSGGTTNLADGFFGLLASSGDWLFNLRNMIKDGDVFNNAIRQLIVWLGQGRDVLIEWFKGITNLEVVQDVAKWFYQLQNVDPSEMLSNFWQWLRRTGYIIRDYGTLLKLLVGDFLNLAPIKAFLDYVKNTFSYDNLKDMLTRLVEYLPDINAGMSNAKNILNDLQDKAVSFLRGIGNSDAVQNFVEYVNSLDGHRVSAFAESIKSGFKNIPGLFSSLKDSMSEMWDTVINALPDISGLGEKVNSIFGDLFEGIKDGSGSIDLSKVGDIITVAISGAIGIAAYKIGQGGFISKIWEALFGAADDAGLLGAATGALESIEGAFTSWQNNLKADTLQKIAIAIALVAASAIALSLVDSERLLSATIAMGTLMAGLVGSAGALGGMKTGDIKGSALALVGLSTALLLLAVALNVIGRMDPEQLGQGIVGVTIGLTELTIAIKALSRGTDSTKMKSMSLSLLVLSVGMIAFGKAVKIMGGLEWSTMEQGLIGFGIALAGFVGFYKGMDSVDEKKLIKVGLSVVILSGGLLVLTKAVESMGGLEWSTMEQGMLGFGAVLAGFVAFSRTVNTNDIIQSSIAVGILGGSLIVLSMALTSLGTMDVVTFQAGIIAMGAGLGILVLSLNLLKGANPIQGAAAILVLSASMIVLGTAMTIMGQLSWEQIAKGLAVLAASLIIFALGGLLLKPVVTTLVLLAAALLLSGLAVLVFGKGIFVAAAAIALLITLGAGVAALIVGIAAALVSAAPMIAEAFVGFIDRMLTALAEKAPEMAEAAKTLIRTLLNAIVELTPEILEGLLKLLLSLLKLIAKNLPEFIQAGFDILIGFLKGIEDNIQEVVDTAVGVVTEFIRGLESSIPDLVDAGVDFVIAFVKAVKDKFVELYPELYEKGLEIMLQVAEGLKKGIEDSVGAIVKGASGLAQAALDAFLRIFQIASPSKKTRWMGQMLGKGLGGGLIDSIKGILESISKVGSKAQNGIKNMVDGLNYYLDGAINTSPTISPVLDLGSISGDMSRLNAVLGAETRSVSISSEFSRKRDAALIADSTGISNSSDSDGSVTFIQNNHSPKALTPAEIYRLTKSQLARLKKRGDT